MTAAYKPRLEELWFREQLMADPETMSYNNAWGGTIPFPEAAWEAWYRAWLQADEGQRYYRYLYDDRSRCFVGEIAYHYDERREIHICDVIVLAKYRNRGYGSAGLGLLCDAAKANGICVLYDDIAADNPSYRLFLRHGFAVEYQDQNVVMVKKTL